MRRIPQSAVLLALLATSVTWGQELKMPASFDKLAARATESENITLDPSMLQLGRQFLSKNDPKQAQVKKVVAQLRGVYVHHFEFAKEGEYSMSDVDSLRAQLKAPEWSRIVDVKSKKENTEICIKKVAGQIQGLIVIDAEPKELAIVQIDGPINPRDLSQLGGQMGIPMGIWANSRQQVPQSEKDIKTP